MARTPHAAQVITELRGAVRDSLKQALLALERSGCDAAGYRLTGPTVERLCVVHLYRSWRLLIAFPEPDLTVVIDVGEHLAHDPRRDVYTRLYEILDLEPTDEPRATCTLAGRLREWPRFPIARLRYTSTATSWSLYSRDRNLRFHTYDRAAPSPRVDELLSETDRDPTGIFWG